MKASEERDISLLVRHLANLDRSPNPYPMTFLYFRALWLNENYKLFCESIKSGDISKRNELIKMFPYIRTLWGFWRDIYSNNVSSSEYSQFDEWLTKNMDRFNINELEEVTFIKEGDVISPKAGTVYYTLPESADIEFWSNYLAPGLLNAITDIEAQPGYSALKLKATNWDKLDKLRVTEQRIDAYYWLRIKEYPVIDCVKLAYNSEKPAWVIFKNDINEVLYGTGKLNVDDLDHNDIKTQQELMYRYSRQGKKVVANVILNKFPSAE